LILAKEVHVAHRQGTVLDDLTLEISEGFVGLLGVNGAGKTTLLNAVAGLRKPQSGVVELDGVDVYGRSGRRAIGKIALVPQELDLPGRLCVREFLLYMAWLRNVPRSGRASKVDGLIEMLNLGDKATSALADLSGGMRRRVLIAQGLVGDPDLLLLDEPTTGLDPEQRYNVRNIVGALAAERTVVMSSHVVEDLAALASRLVVLNKGQIVFDGSVDELRSADSSGSRDPEAGFLAILKGRES